jgi:uncharacterized protein (TIGR00251 family)
MLMNGVYEKKSDGIFVSLHVQPGSSRSGFSGVYNDRLKLKVSGKAVEGAANQCVCEFIAQYFGVSKSSVSLTQGEKSREKRLFVRGDADAFARQIETLLSAVQET